MLILASEASFRASCNSPIGFTDWLHRWAHVILPWKAWQLRFAARATSTRPQLSELRFSSQWKSRSRPNSPASVVALSSSAPSSGWQVDRWSLSSPPSSVQQTIGPRHSKPNSFACDASLRPYVSSRRALKEKKATPWRCKYPRHRCFASRKACHAHSAPGAVNKWVRRTPVPCA